MILKTSFLNELEKILLIKKNHSEKFHAIAKLQLSKVVAATCGGFGGVGAYPIGGRQKVNVTKPPPPPAYEMDTINGIHMHYPPLVSSRPPQAPKI